MKPILAYAALTAFVAGCSNGASSVDRDSTSAVLPARGFLQFTEPQVGSSRPTGNFHYADATGAARGPFGEPRLRYDGQARSSLLIVEQSGATTVLADRQHIASAQSVMSDKFRFVCAAFLPVKPTLMVGPTGTVVELERSAGSTVTCWGNKLGTTTWHSATITSPHALALIAVRPLATGTDIEVGVNQDEFWDLLDQSAPGRTAGFIVRKFQFPTEGGVPTISQARDAQNQAFDEGYFGDDHAAKLAFGNLACSSGECGKKVDWRGEQVDCGPAPSGSVCGPKNRPVASCTPKPVAEVCANSASGAKACSVRSNGCGGVIDCGGCATGQSCGGGRELLYCGRHDQLPTEETIRAAYADGENRLCGTLRDPLTGQQITLVRSRPGTCSNNLIVD